MQTVFVTGAEGFTGRHLLAHLRQHGSTVVAGVRNRARKLAFEREGVKAIVCDVADAINVARVVASVRPDRLVHLAGPTDQAAAAHDPLLAYQTTVTAWTNILDAVRRTVARARVVLASSWDVYGTAGAEVQPLTETTPAAPTTLLGSWKLAAEGIAAAFFRHYHLNVAIARVFPYTGPGQSDRSFWGSVGRRLAAAAANGNQTELRLPSLSGPHDVLHVNDVVTAYDRLLQDGRPNEIYNISAGRTWSCREIIETAAQQLGVHVTLTEAAADGACSTPAGAGDNAKARDHLGWQPTATPAEAICDLVNSLRTPTPAPTQPVAV